MEFALAFICYAIPVIVPFWRLRPQNLLARMSFEPCLTASAIEIWSSLAPSVFICVTQSESYPSPPGDALFSPNSIVFSLLTTNRAHCSQRELIHMFSSRKYKFFTYRKYERVDGRLMQIAYEKLPKYGPMPRLKLKLSIVPLRSLWYWRQPFGAKLFWLN